MNSDRVLNLLQHTYTRGFYFKDVRSDFDSTDWQSLANVSDPIVLLCSKDQLNQAVESLIMHGLSPAAPCMLIQPETASNEHSNFIKGTLADIHTRALRIPGGKTYLVLSGKDEVLPGALFGKRVLVTRAKKQAPTLTGLLQAQGAEALEIPAIEIVLKKDKVLELLNAIRKVNEFRWVIFTSVNTVKIVDEILKESGWSWEVFKDTQIAAIGKSTAEAIRTVGGAVSLVPPKFQAENLAEALIESGVSGANILLPRAEGSRKILPEALTAAGAKVNEIQIYVSQVPEESRRLIKSALSEGSIDFITFTSSSTVHNFIALGADLISRIDFAKTAIACIGPITADTLKEYGMPVHVEATEFTIEGLVQAIIKYQEK